MRILIVGAGAVGQVYGRHLALGGAEVAFFVREKYAAAARAGFDLYPLDRADARAAPVRLEGFAVLTSAAEVASGRFDAVLLCVSSTAIREGSWLAEIAAASGEATVAMLQPGIEDRAVVAAAVPGPRLVRGMIGMVSYLAPLPGERVPRPGVAYWLPPLSETPLAGPDDRVRPLVDALRRGGLRARAKSDVDASLAFGGAILDTHVAALECAGWSFRGLARDPELVPLAGRAAREMLAVAARRLGVRAPLLPRLLLRPLAVRLLLRLAPRLAPLDLETYFRVHFSKVGDQTRLALGTALELARRFDLPAEGIAELAARLALPAEVTMSA